MIRFALPILFFIAIFFSAVTAENSTEHSHRILADIKTPQQLLFPHLPSEYTVELQLSGIIAEEMKLAATRLGLEEPLYQETFDGELFSVLLANENYPQNTRDLLLGILNPAEIIDMSIEAVLQYKSNHFISDLHKNTTISVQRSNYNQQPVWNITVTPSNKHFGYSFEDMGAAIKESWFERLELTVDTALKVIYTIDALQIERIYGSAQQAAPEVSNRTIRYDFKYQLQNLSPLPSGFNIIINGVQLLSINATYKEYEHFSLFSEKKVCSFRGREKKCLVVSYGDYSFSVSRSSRGRRNVSGSGVSTRDLSRAASLSARATELMRNGNISASRRVINMLVERYPQTPQAIEAKRILMSLPPGVY